MQGYPNHHYLSNSKYLGRCITQNKFTLLTDGIIPYLSREIAAHHISGELYDVNETDIESLDMLESRYIRSEIDVELMDGAVHTAGVYFKEDKNMVYVVPSGDYRDIMSPDDF